MIVPPDGILAAFKGLRNDNEGAAIPSGVGFDDFLSTFSPVLSTFVTHPWRSSH
jgi:hypothetical protein